MGCGPAAVEPPASIKRSPKMPGRTIQIFRINGSSPQYIDSSRFATRAQRALASGARHCSAEPGEGLAELWIGDPGKAVMDEIGLAHGEQARARPARRRIEG